MDTIRGNRSAALTGVQRLVDWLSGVQPQPGVNEPAAVGTSGSLAAPELNTVTETQIGVAVLPTKATIKTPEPAEDAPGDASADPPAVAASLNRPLELSGIEPVERLPRRPTAIADAATPVSAAPADRPMRLAVDNVPSGPSEEQLVRQLLDEYAGAYERLDVPAIKAVRPTVDDKALKRAFERLSAQRLTLQSCGITISGSTANARCHGSATYQPRIGNRVYEIASGEWTFALSKKDAAWKIVDTLVQ